MFFTGAGLRMSLAGQGLTDRPYSIGLRFAGARPDARPVGRKRTQTEVNHFRGAPDDWKTGLSTYSELVYRNLWPGIDLVYSGTGGRLKYSFLVRPGADPSAIQLDWQGAVGTKVARGGELEVSTPAGVLREDAPYSFQSRGGRRVKVDSSYALAADDRYGFRIGAYDKSRPLVIDPAVLVYAGFIGGSGEEQANNVVLDGARNLYVAGRTTSTDFPATTGSFDQSFGGLADAFVAKVNPSGTGLLYASYIGGAGEETAIGIDRDATGAVYVAGSTTSGTGFPARVGPDTSYNGGPQDAWVAKLAPDGANLDYAGFIGGSAASVGPPGAPNEQANGLAVDSAGRAYVSGFTASAEDTFPDNQDAGGDGDAFDGIPGFDQTFNSAFPGLLDAFVVRVAANGSGFEYGTYIGGGGVDAGTGLVVDGTGNVYANVFTGSNQNPPAQMNPFGGFPVTPGSFDPTFNGGTDPPPLPVDVAVVKLDTAGTGAGSLVYGTYIGGAGVEQPFGNVLDSSGNLYLTGQTGSDHATFPNGGGFASLSVPGFDQTFNGGEQPRDTFVAKLNAAGTGLGYATYVGGAGDEQAVAIDIDPSRSAYISGTTSSTQASFPVRAGPDLTYNGGEADAYAAKLDPTGTALGYAGYIGGGDEETGIGMAVDPFGNAHVAGGTNSSQANGFPVTVGPDTTFNGASGEIATFADAFVARIAEVAASVPPGSGPVGPQPTPPFADCPALTANVIRGSAAGERLNGTPLGDRIYAGTGNDVVDGLAGGDCIDLGPGGDRGQGGSGNDLLIGGLGADRMLGSSGNDRLRGGSSGDRLTGGSGNDRLHGQSGSDRVNGERGRDRINGGSANDVISTGSSADRAAGDQGNDRLAGNSGNDALLGNSGRDRISGGSGRDRLAGGSGNDRIGARDGRRDRVNCGSGRDTVVADPVDVVAGNCERVRRR